jgi:hypothetical protein
MKSKAVPLLPVPCLSVSVRVDDVGLELGLIRVRGNVHSGGEPRKGAGSSAVAKALIGSNDKGPISVRGSQQASR